MIAALDARPLASGLSAAGRALVERFGAGPADLPETASAPEWVEALTARLPMGEACSVLEHLFGILPLAGGCFAPGALCDVATGRKLGALGLFTPTPEPGLEESAVDGEAFGERLLLHGEVRLSSPVPDGALVLVRLAGPEYRLAWLESAEAARRGSRTGGTVRADTPCWLVLEGITVESARISRPVSLAPDSDLRGQVDEYAAVWALAALTQARRGIRALRRAARVTRHRGRPFSGAQQIALDVTGVEIETELAISAARGAWALATDDPARAAGLTLAVAAGRILGALAAQARELADLGLDLEADLGVDLARPLAFLGGPLLVESELGRAFGIQDPPELST